MNEFKRELRNRIEEPWQLCIIAALMLTAWITMLTLGLMLKSGTGSLAVMSPVNIMAAIAILALIYVTICFVTDVIGVIYKRIIAASDEKLIKGKKTE